MKLDSIIIGFDDRLDGISDQALKQYIKQYMSTLYDEVLVCDDVFGVYTLIFIHDEDATHHALTFDESIMIDYIASQITLLDRRKH